MLSSAAGFRCTAAVNKATHATNVTLPNLESKLEARGHGVVVLDGRADGGDELEEDDQVLLDPEVETSWP